MAYCLSNSSTSSQWELSPANERVSVAMSRYDVDAVFTTSWICQRVWLRRRRALASESSGQNVPAINSRFRGRSLCMTR